MSLAVQIKKIVGVLLDDGDWHEVRPGSMAVNKFELADGDDTLVRGGSIPGVSCMGLAFKENEGGLMIACPITSVKAVRYRVEDSLRSGVISASLAGIPTKEAIPVKNV
ncbi:MAG: hypothetical protein K0S45_1796 [Nitrospira sp.]|jgi:hypothetical protein|nr:hypothetical protein [Nitrospira sp.]